MKKIILWYSKNREKIWKNIAMVVIVIVTIQVIKYLWINRTPKNTISSNNNIGNELNSIRLEDTKSTLSGKNISKSQSESLSTLDTFIDYCNNNKINEAYELVSDDCKNEMYKTVDIFKEQYYNKIFGDGKRDISVENWIGNIYKVKFIKDALSTGIYSTEENIQDYITIITDENGNTKLNINNYIGKEEINTEQEKHNIKIRVVEKNQYMNFEKYTFEITNNSDKTVLMNNINELDTMYLEDDNEIKYYAYMHELSQAQLELLSGETKNITIKYYSKYGSTKDIEKIVFSKIILNYDAYTNYQNIAYYNEYGAIQIKL